MAQTQTPWRAMRETTKLSLREVGRRTGIEPWRMSLIERGVAPTEDEAAKLKAVLIAAMLPQEGGAA